MSVCRVHSVTVILEVFSLLLLVLSPSSLTLPSVHFFMLHPNVKQNKKRHSRRWFTVYTMRSSVMVWLVFAFKWYNFLHLVIVMMMRKRVESTESKAIEMNCCNIPKFFFIDSCSIHQYIHKHCLEISFRISWNSTVYWKTK